VRPAFRSAGADPSAWIKPADKPLTFRTMGQKKEVTLVPLTSILTNAIPCTGVAIAALQKE
jgi:hypothetical protein